MVTKLQTLKDAAALGDWRKAIAIAARFPKLDNIRAEVLDAHMAYTNPRFFGQLGRDIEAAKVAGEFALRTHYGIE